MKTYHYGDTEQISTHFRALEFQCKCAGRHEFRVDEKLVELLEKLHEKLDCSAINISSGFRCLSHDKAVGGSGTGQHIHGKAADICCYDKDGKAISSKIVCCRAQDLGFTGIARINDSYTHVDVRAGKWLGDETKGGNYCIPVADFYQYFGIVKIPEPGSSAALKKGDTGDAVEMMQARLHALGYLRKSEIDGDFGRITLGALLAFQLENGLAVDGICGPKTKTALGI